LIGEEALRGWESSFWIKRLSKQKIAMLERNFFINFFFEIIQDENRIINHQSQNKFLVVL